MSASSVPFYIMNGTDSVHDLPPEVGLTELRDHLGDFVERAQVGEEIIITERGRAVAKLTPVHSRYEELVRDGTIRPAVGPRLSLEELAPPLDLGVTISDLIRR